MSTRVNSLHSLGFFSVMTEKSFEKKIKTIKIKFIAKIITILLVVGFIIYIFIDYNNFNKIMPDDLYPRILNNYDNIYIYAIVIDYLSNYHVFLILFIMGFCLWNIYKSFIHILGFFIIALIVFILKLIFRKKAQIFYIEFDKKSLSDESINEICELTSEYECPSYRAACFSNLFLYVFYHSFIQRKKD